LSGYQFLLDQTFDEVRLVIITIFQRSLIIFNQVNSPEAAGLITFTALLAQILINAVEGISFSNRLCRTDRQTGVTKNAIIVDHVFDHGSTIAQKKYISRLEPP
jgi:hypothetical protein